MMTMQIVLEVAGVVLNWTTLFCRKTLIFYMESHRNQQYSTWWTSFIQCISTGVSMHLAGTAFEFCKCIVLLFIAKKLQSIFAVLFIKSIFSICWSYSFVFVCRSIACASALNILFLGELLFNNPFTSFFLYSFLLWHQWMMMKFTLARKKISLGEKPWNIIKFFYFSAWKTQENIIHLTCWQMTKSK